MTFEKMARTFKTQGNIRERISFSKWKDLDEYLAKECDVRDAESRKKILKKMFELVSSNNGFGQKGRYTKSYEESLDYYLEGRV